MLAPEPGVIVTPAAALAPRSETITTWPSTAVALPGIEMVAADAPVESTLMNVVPAPPATVSEPAAATLTHVVGRLITQLT
jgi:hypothetical protein